MARVLIGWELGAGRGHSSRLLELGRTLAQRGHEPLYAPQQIGPFAAHGKTWQAPVWPRLLGPLGRRYPQQPATMGDMLAYLGLDDPEAIAAMIMAWERIIEDARPDAVVSEYAPILQLTVRQRVPCLAWGTGFSLPPDYLLQFPSFSNGMAVVAEDRLLATVNDSLGRTGRRPLVALPQIFAADRSLVASFAELDPYRQWRRGPTGVPAVEGRIPRAAGERREIFVYFNTLSGRPASLWSGLWRAGFPVRVYDPTIGDEDAATLEEHGFSVERQPVPFGDIAARSRLVVSHGGLGFASSALLAGIPQIVIPFDQEKNLTADALAELGIGQKLMLDGLEAANVSGALQTAWPDAALHERARNVSQAFGQRMTITAEAEAADLVEGLL